MKYKLPATISSVPELTALILEVENYARWLSRYSIMQKVSRKKATDSPSLSPSASELIRNWNADKQPTRSSMNDLISSLENTKKKAQTITITLATPASLEIRKQLIEWCRENLSPNLLVNFQFNSTILGGMVIKLGSHIYDWSFKRQILANRSHFPEVLRRV